MIECLKKLCNAFGPSGMEDEVREIIINEIKDYCDSYRTDAVGNLWATKKGKNRRKDKLLLAAHMDEVGLMTTYISEEGYLYFDTIGGISRTVLAGHRVVVRTDSGDINGAIAAKAIHIQTPEERGVCVPISELYVEAGFLPTEKEEAQASLGDCMVFKPNFELFGKGYIKSKALDDRAGCAILIDIIKSELEYDTDFIFTVCEESGDGSRGANAASYASDATNVLVVETTTAADLAGVPKSMHCCELGKGAVISFMDNVTIYDKGLFATAQKVASEKEIKYQFKTLIAGGNDAKSFQKGAVGKKVLAVSIPARYLHSACTVISESDLIETTKLCKALANEGRI